MVGCPAFALGSGNLLGCAGVLLVSFLTVAEVEAVRNVCSVMGQTADEGIDGLGVELVAAADDGGNQGIVGEIEGGELVVRTGEDMETGKVDEVEGDETVLAAVEIVQCGEVSKVEFGQLIAGAVEVVERRESSGVECGQLIAHAGQVFECSEVLDAGKVADVETREVKAGGGGNFLVSEQTVGAVWLGKEKAAEIRVGEILDRDSDSGCRWRDLTFAGHEGSKDEGGY